MGYCHCASCRHWSAGPVNAFTLLEAVVRRRRPGARTSPSGTVQQDETPSARKFCKACGGHVFSEHPGLGLTDVYAATIPSLEFKPIVHVNYAEAVLRMKDSLPKNKRIFRRRWAAPASNYRSRPDSSVSRRGRLFQVGAPLHQVAPTARARPGARMYPEAPDDVLLESSGHAEHRG